jgi:hypothetical protein
MRPFTVVGLLLVAAAAACKGDTIQSPAGSRPLSASSRDIQAQAGSPLFVLDCPPGFTFLVAPGNDADRNMDNIVCTKLAGTTLVTIDNNAHGPPRKKA